MSTPPPMKTQTQVQISLSSIQISQNLYIQPDGFILRFFLSCSQINSKPIKIRGQYDSNIKNQSKLKIKNIVGEELEIWFCTTYNKLIAVGKVLINKQGEEQIEVQLKLSNILFAKLRANINFLYLQYSITRRQIQKIIYVQPDQQLLKKQEDPQEVRKRQEQEQRRIKEQEQLQRLAKIQKKHAITITYLGTKQQPFM